MRWRTDQALRSTGCLGVQTTGWVGLAREAQCPDPTRTQISCPFTWRLSGAQASWPGEPEDSKDPVLCSTPAGWPQPCC